jgi:hypothetical protein
MPVTNRMKSLPFFLILFLLGRTAINAQKNQAFQNDSLFKKFALTEALEVKPDSSYYIVQWNNGQPSFRIVREIADNLFIVQINRQSEIDSLQKQARIAPSNDSWKLSPQAEKQIEKPKGAEEKFLLTGLNIHELLTALKNHQKHLTVLAVNQPTHTVIVQCKPSYLKKTLLALKQIIFVDIATEAHPETNIIGYDRSFHGINAVDFLIPGANGKNVVAGVKEQKIDENDIDVIKRVLPSPLDAPTTSYHATVIASIIGGAGNSSYNGKGIAWGCLFFPSSFSNLFADDANILNTNKVTIQNHSYGTIIQQFYGAEAVSYDLLTWNNKNYIPVMSSGNQGNASATEGKYAGLPGYANLTGNFKMAKNSITVGAVDNKEIISPLSSAGPLYDGRIAPQLTALGPGGTSDAAAMVSGTIAVMQQVYADSNNNTIPPASLVKAVLYNTADDIHRPGIDYKTGYGLLNSYASVKAIQQKKFDGSTVGNGQQWAKSITVPVNTAALKVTLAWTDTAATVNNNKAIVHDLDLEVTEMSTGTVYLPWVLNISQSIDSLSKLPVRQRDSLNTAEQVSIRLPQAGNYQVTVKGTSVRSAAIPFHIAYQTDTLNTFTFTNPLHTSDINTVENQSLSIRWKTHVADTNESGSLFISYDNGTTWQLLRQSIKLATGKHQWTVPDTNAVAQLKMETRFGNFLSTRFIISQPTKLEVDFNCADSFRLLWKKHIYATAYQIYALVDSAYLKPLMVVTDTFAVLQTSLYPFRVYAIEPKLSNGISAARSGAQNIDLLGVNCFYKTLNYYLLDYNKLNLQLELSTTLFVDSIYFEKVSVAGQLLQTVGGSKVENNKLLYTQFMEELSSGITYVRGRIKLKNGATVYTDIIPVLTSGQKKILFYPNPAARSTFLSYVLQQGVPASSKLQLFDATGRLLKFHGSLPDKIDLTGIAPGLIIYKLMDEDNKVLETGKLVISH